MSRKNSRDSLFKLVFEYLFSRRVNEVTLNMLSYDASLTDEDKEYIRSTYLGIIGKYGDLTSIITKYITGYSSVDRLVKADLAGLLIAVYEMKFIPDIPTSVSINEAVELVKQYSTDKSSGFVNGVLASINKEIE